MSGDPEKDSNNYHGEIAHEHNLYAGTVAEIGDFTVTNSLINSWLVVLVVVILSIVISRNLKQVPGKLQNGLELLMETFLGLFDFLTGSRKQSIKFFPIAFSFFIFILLSNWMGLLPIIGSVGLVIMEEGQKYFIPYFRGATADLNTTLALAIVGVLISHVVGIVTVGGWNYFNKFINIRAVLEIPGKVRKDPGVLAINPIKIFNGLIEIIGEIAKVASLSFRLYGNIFAGEVLLAFIAGLIVWGVPIPFMFLELFVGLIQAVIFTMLVLTYLVIMSMEEH